MKRPVKPKGLLKGSLLTLACFGGLMYVRNHLIPKFGDDYAYAFIWDGKNHGNIAFGNHSFKRVRSVKDLVISQMSEYMTFSGRNIYEGLNQLFLMKDSKKWFNIANTAVPVLQILVCDWLSRGRIRLSGIPSSLMKALAAGYWFGTPHLACTAIWQTGATNYSWAGLGQSAFLLNYSLADETGRFPLPVPLAILSGLLAGWSSEAGGGAACLLAGVSLLRDRSKGADRGRKWAGFISACIGYAILISAPGNFERIRIEQEYSDAIPEDFSYPGHVPDGYAYKPEMFRHFFLHSFLPVVLRLAPLNLPVLLYFLQGKKGGERITRRILELEGTALLIPSVLMLSPQFPRQAAYSSVIYALSAMDLAWDYVDFASLRTGCGAIVPIVKTLGMAYLFVNIAAALIVDADWGGQLRAAEAILEENRGAQSVTVPQTVVSPLWSSVALDRAVDPLSHEFMCIEEDPEGIYNKVVAAYYGVGKVKATSGAEHPYNKKLPFFAQLLYPVKKILKRLFG